MPRATAAISALLSEYNQERPHESLGDRPPATVYHVSARSLPARVPPLEYAGHLEIRRVGSNGCIGWGGRPLFLTEVLAGEDVGLEEIDEGIWTLYFGSVRLGRVDERTRTLTELPTATTDRPVEAAGPVDAKSAPTRSLETHRRVFHSSHRPQ